ncbi:MAG: hypothetical protein NTW38_10845 [Candidatus Aminicenantes bacterium]|nr:hypothetical protein [Candidatus Aminicenantes bacterium]
MPEFTFGDFTICAIAVAELSTHVDQNTELGKQLLECLGKLDTALTATRISAENASAVEPLPH